MILENYLHLVQAWTYQDVTTFLVCCRNQWKCSRQWRCWQWHVQLIRRQQLLLDNNGRLPQMTYRDAPVTLHVRAFYLNTRPAVQKCGVLLPCIWASYFLASQSIFQCSAAAIGCWFSLISDFRSFSAVWPADPDSVSRMYNPPHTRAGQIHSVCVKGYRTIFQTPDESALQYVTFMC